MKWDQVEGNWEQVKGQVRKMWGKLTDDDILTISGQKQVLLGKIQERYGFAREIAERQLEKFMSEAELRKSAEEKTHDSF